MIVRINNKTLACYMGFNPNIDITPDVLREYINGGHSSAEVKLRRRSLEWFFLAQAIKPKKKRKRRRKVL